jgi:hypothetical protein
MMGGETFILLKAAVLGPKSTKQAETRPDVLPTILSIAGPLGAGSLREAQKNTCQSCIAADFRGIWLISFNSRILSSRSQFQPEF